MRKQSGFTLIELMVVMAIIAILATAGLTAYSSYLKKARDTARAQIARELMTKVEELANGGRNPTGGELIAFLDAENFASTVQSSILSSLYLPDIDPLSGKKQCYDFGGNIASSQPCMFVYVTFTDGTYLIGYGLEHPDSRDRPAELFYPTGAANYIDDPAGLGIEDLSLTSGTGWWAGNWIGTNNTPEIPSMYIPSTNVRDAQVISSHQLWVP